MATQGRAAVGRAWSSAAAVAAVTGHPEHVSVIRDSHARCVALGLTRIDQPEHARLIRADLGVARERNRRLHSHAAPIMELLYDQIAGTESMIVLTDSHGTILHAVGDDAFLERASKVALAPGANWAEQSKGTNAVGTALFAERPTLVHADEHYMHANGFLTCSAAPIFDPRGNVIGVLDVSGDQRSYHQHTMGLVRMSARMIENHWLCDDSSERLRIHFHARAEFIGTLLEGILVVGADGRIVGANRSALDQLGIGSATIRMHTLDSLVGLHAGAIMDAFRTAMPMPRSFVLGDGRRFHFRAWPGAASQAIFAPVPELPPAAHPVETVTLPRDTRAEPRLADLATGDARVGASIERLHRVLDRGIAWMVSGESGTGKEWLAGGAPSASRPTPPPFLGPPPTRAGPHIRLWCCMRRRPVPGPSNQRCRSTVAPSTSTSSATGPPPRRPSCCAPWTSAAATSPAAGSVSWPRAAVRRTSGWPRAACARICTTASTDSRCAGRRCASAATWRRSRGGCCSAWRERMHPGSAPRWPSSSRGTPGPATCVSSRACCRPPRCWPKAVPRSAPSICPTAWPTRCGEAAAAPARSSRRRSR